MYEHTYGHISSRRVIQPARWGHTNTRVARRHTTHDCVSCIHGLHNYRNNMLSTLMLIRPCTSLRSLVA